MTGTIDDETADDPLAGRPGANDIDLRACVNGADGTVTIHAPADGGRPSATRWLTSDLAISGSDAQ